MNTFHKRKSQSQNFSFVAFITIVALIAFFMGMKTPIAENTADITGIAIDYTVTHNSALLAPDAELHYAGDAQPIIGRNRIESVNNALYRSSGVTLGVDLSVIGVTPMSDNWVMVEYVYTGTVFYGDVYPLELMIDYETVELNMIALYQIEDGLIVRQYVLQNDAPLPFAVNITAQ